MKTLYKGSCFDYLESGVKFDCIIADPPDAIGLGYEGFTDIRPEGYSNFVYRMLGCAVGKAPILWFSVNSKHMDLMGSCVASLLRKNPSYSSRVFIWTYTFGQHRETDWGNMYRPIWRLRQEHFKWAPPGRVRSTRQRMGDSRANPEGKIPGDVWAVPRVTGNSSERRSYHPTQHPEEIYRKMLEGSGKPGRVLDMFAGTGTIYRCTEGTLWEPTACEISEEYCCRLQEEHCVHFLDNKVSIS